MPTPPHYAPVNEYVYGAALSGCVAGAMGSQPITSVNDETYGDTADNAVAFAEEFDTLWDGASLDVVQYEAILDSCAAYWRGRIPQSSVPEEYEFICDALISMVNETDAAAIAAGATPPPWPPSGGGGSPGSAGYVIFRPGVASSGQAVATTAEVNTAADNGAIRLLVDSSGGAATLPAGFTLDPRFISVEGVNVGFPGFSPDLLTLADTAKWSVYYVVGLQVSLACTTTGVWVFPAANIEPVVLVDNTANVSSPNSATVPAYKAPSGVFAQFTVRGNSQALGGTGAPLFSAAAGGTIELFACEASFVNATALGSDAGGTAFFTYDASETPPAFSMGTVTLQPVDNDNNLIFATGTVFPVSNLQAGQRFLRTDLGLGALYVYNGTAWVPAGQLIQFEFTASGTFTVPPGIIAIRADAVGGGGGGGGGASGGTASETISGAGGGGGGARLVSGVLSPNPGNILTITIGAGGAGGAAGEPGAIGADTTITNGSSANGLWAPGASGGDSGTQSGLGGADRTANGVGAGEISAFQLSSAYGSQSSYVKLLASVGVSVVNGGAGLNAGGFDNIGGVKLGGAGGTDGVAAAANAGGGGGGGGNAGDGGGSNATTPDGGAGGAGNAAGIGGNGSPGTAARANTGSGGGGGGGGGSGSVSGGPGSNGGNGGSGFVRLTLVL